MTPQVNDLLCPYCGGEVEAGQKTCAYCKQPISISNSQEASFQTGVNADFDIDSMLKNAFNCLNYGEFVKANEILEQVLNSDNRNARAYVGKLMVELRVKLESDLQNNREPLSDNKNYAKAINYADSSYRATLEGFNQEILDRIERKKTEDIYNKAMSLKKDAANDAQYRDVAEIFRSIVPFKNAEALAAECEMLAKSIKIKREKTRKVSLIAITAIVTIVFLSWSINNVMESRSLARNAKLLSIASHGSLQEISSLIRGGADVDLKNSNDETPLLLAAADNPNKGVVAALIKAGSDTNAKNKSGQTALMLAAQSKQNNAPENIKDLAEAKADVNAKNSNGETALMQIEKEPSKADAIIALIAAGADINGRNGNGETFLMRAILNKQKSGVVNALIKAKADINVKNKDGDTALIFAAQDNAEPEIIIALIAAGANVNEKNQKGETALMHAVMNRQKQEVINALTKAGADLKAKNDKGQTVLMLAVSNNSSQETMKTLMGTGASIDESDKEGRTALMYAVESSNPDIILMLHKAGAGINAKNNKGQTALIFAAQNESPSVEVIKTLLAVGAKPDIIDNTGHNALMHVVQKKANTEIISLLSKAGSGVDVNAQNRKGQTALIISALNKAAPEIISALAASGADLDIADNDGQTALMHAEQEKNPELILALIKAGANVDVKNKKGETALIRAIQSAQPIQVINTILKTADVEAKNTKGETALMMAASSSDAELVNALLAAKANVNAIGPGPGKFTPLMYAAQKNSDPEVVVALSKAGADLNAKNDNGQTALMLAVLNNKNLEIIKAITASGADIDSTAPNGQTALMYAADKSQTPEIITILLNGGADPTLRDGSGKTALSYARNNKKLENTDAYWALDKVIDDDLATLKWYEASTIRGGFKVHPKVKDNFGKTYINGVGGISDYGASWQTYNLGGRYKKIKGRIVLNYDYRTWTRNAIVVNIYADNDLIYTSPEIKEGVQPIDFSLDISDVGKLKIEVASGLMIRIVDCILTKQ